MIPLLEASELRVQRGGVTVLYLPSFTLGEGETICLLGPNGAGKTSLLLAFTHLLPFSGVLRFRGKRVNEEMGELEYRRKTATVFQDPLLLDANVYENVALGLKLRGLKGGEVRRRVGMALEYFGIQPLASRHARKLSGGEAKRVSLARAFAVSPELVFLDEPFSSLDPPTREDLLHDLKRVLKETKTGAIVATHDRLEALILSEKMGVIRAGQIIQMGPTQEVMNKPANEFVASFVGIETTIPGEVVETANGLLYVRVSGSVTLAAVGSFRRGEKVFCFIRPEHVTLMPAGLQFPASARNNLSGEILEIGSLGIVYRVVIDCGFLLHAMVTPQSVEEMELRPGKAISASFKATAVHLVKA